MRTKILIFFLGLMPFCTWAELGTSSTNTNQLRPNALYDKEGNVLPEDPNNPDINWSRLGHSGNARWRAVGSLEKHGKATCTTTLFQIPSCTDPKRKAQVLTNGHCTKTKDGLSVTFDMFHNTPKASRVKSSVTRSLYDSYDGLDIAILELDQSYSQLNAKGIEAMTIAKEPLRSSKKYDLVSVPLNNMKEDPSLYKSECDIGNKVTLIDTDHLWNESVEFTGCSAVGGSSGSSLSRNGEISGLLNAGNRNIDFEKEGKHPCRYDSCSYGQDRELKHEAKNYGFDVSFLHRCYEGCTLNPELKDCPLPKASSKITVKSNDPYPSNWVSNLDSKFVITSNFNSYQIKACPQAQTSCDCKDPSGYQASSASMFTPSDYLPGVNTQAAVGDQPRLYLFCVRGVDQNGKLDDINNVTTYPIFHNKEKSKIPPLFRRR